MASARSARPILRLATSGACSLRSSMLLREEARPAKTNCLIQSSCKRSRCERYSGAAESADEPDPDVVVTQGRTGDAFDDSAMVRSLARNSDESLSFSESISHPASAPSRIKRQMCPESSREWFR